MGVCEGPEHRKEVREDSGVFQIEKGNNTSRDSHHNSYFVMMLFQSIGKSYIIFNLGVYSYMNLSKHFKYCKVL